MLTLSERVELAVKAGFKKADLARAAGRSSAAVAHWARGRTFELGWESAHGVAKLTGWSAQWWHNGTGPQMQTPVRGVDHPLSQIGPIVSPTTIEWGDLMTEPLPAAFSLVFRDDAMAPDFPISSIGRFATDRQPVPGRPVLVADSAGNAYVRDYRPRTADHWLAVARNTAYQPLDSSADGLRVLAVMTGHDWP